MNAQIIQEFESYNEKNPQGPYLDPEYEFAEKLNAEIDRRIKSLSEKVI